MPLTQAPCNEILHSMARLHVSTSSAAAPAAAVIKQVALRLFAEKGVDGVTVREIVAAAGQKNHGAVGYYFGTKEALVRELVMDGAVALEQLRNAELDRLEASGGPHSLREVVDVLVMPVTSLVSDWYVRFITIFGMTHRDMMLDAIDPQWNRAYGRCLEHLRHLLPELPREMQNQRFVFMGAYISAVLSARERALADHSRSHPMWAGTDALADFAGTVVALLRAPAESGGNAGDPDYPQIEPIETPGPMG